MLQDEKGQALVVKIMKSAVEREGLAIDNLFRPREEKVGDAGERGLNPTEIWKMSVQKLLVHFSTNEGILSIEGARGTDNP